MTPRQVRAQQTKKKILDIALELFAEQGYDNVTVDEIVLKSGTSKGAFYTHFKSKHEIFLEKFREIDNLYVELSSTIPDSEGSVSAMFRLLSAQMNYLHKTLGIQVIRTIYMNALDPGSENFLGRKDRPLYSVIHSLVERGKQRGEFKSELPVDEITMLITRCMRGTLYDWCLFNGDFDLVDQSHKIIGAILNVSPPLRVTDD